MIKDIPQVLPAPISQFRLTHFMGLMTYTRDQWLAAFDADHPAPGKLPGGDIWPRELASAIGGPVWCNS